MRVWDIHPGYLNRQSLLGEHRELHGIVAILTQNKTGYSKHPETLRWVKHGWALKQRHRLLAAEMALRGFTDQSPVRTRSSPSAWPEIFIDAPWTQLELLSKKYQSKEQGRIPLPANAQALWAQHKYSVMARGPALYRDIGRSVSRRRSRQYTQSLAMELVEILRLAPSPGGIRNAGQHMWGYVSQHVSCGNKALEFWSNKRLLQETQRLAMFHKTEYLSHSTALSELLAWL